MTDACIACRGFDLNGFHVPAFDLRAGEVITVQVPTRSDLQRTLAASLVGHCRRPEVEAAGLCLFAEPANPPVGLRRWFHDPTPKEWLSRRGFSGAEAHAILARHRIDGDWPLSRYAANPRALLGLEAAYRQEPDVIVFHTQGLDPVGVLKVQELVTMRLDRTAALYLSTRVLSNGRESFRVFPGSAVIEVVVRPTIPV